MLNFVMRMPLSIFQWAERFQGFVFHWPLFSHSLSLSPFPLSDASYIKSTIYLVSTLKKNAADFLLSKHSSNTTLIRKLKLPELNSKITLSFLSTINITSKMVSEHPLILGFCCRHTFQRFSSFFLKPMRHLKTKVFWNFLVT